MPITFKVNSVQPNASALRLVRVDVSDYFKKQDYGLVCPDSHSNHAPFLTVHMHKNRFLSALMIAFYKHLPFSLRPQHFWMLILQAVTKHVQSNSEKLRNRFVCHEEKDVIKIVCNDFVYEAVGNDWV